MNENRIRSPSEQQGFDRANKRPLRLGLALAVLIILIGPARADCMSICQDAYWSCTNAYAERDCATTRSICQMRCSLDRFGAIAYSDRSDAYGWSVDTSSRHAAEQRALRECRAQAEAANDCRVLTWFRAACGALARNPGGSYGADWGHNEEDAARNAITVCEAYDGSACEVERVACSR